MNNRSHSSNGRGTDPANPYNIDFERERRLKRMFQVFIGGGFVLAAILLAAAFFFDAWLARRNPGPAPITPYSAPGTPLQSDTTVPPQNTQP